MGAMRGCLLRYAAVVLLVAIQAGGAPAQDWWVDAQAGGRSDGSAQAPWADLSTALAHPGLGPGDTIFMRPGIYRGSDRWIRTPGIRLTRDPASSGRVILDGGVALPDLCNRLPDGTQKTRDNGARFTKVLGVQAGADGVTIDGLEVRHGHVGIFTEAARTRILDCHVHHTSQNGISSTGSQTEIAFCIVHDVVLYNLDGQCLTKGVRADGSPDRDTRKKVVRADGTVTTTNMDWGQGITCKGDYPRDPSANFTKIGSDGLVHDNLLWNAWSEGFGTFISRRTALVANTAFNIWRIGYYLQNADQAVLEGNAILFQDTFDAWALRGGIAFANELDRRFFAGSHPTDPFLLPDTSGAILRDNSAIGGSTCLTSVFGRPLNTQADQTLTIAGNLLADPPGAEPCLEIAAQVRGSIRVTGNVFLKAGADPATESRFFERRDAAGAQPAQVWTIAGNRRAGLPTGLTAVNDDLRVLVQRAQALAALPDDQESAPALAQVRAQAAVLRRRLDHLRAEQSTAPNAAPRILRTGARSTNLTP